MSRSTMHSGVTDLRRRLTQWRSLLSERQPRLEVHLKLSLITWDVKSTRFCLINLRVCLIDTIKREFHFLVAERIDPVRFDSLTATAVVD